MIMNGLGEMELELEGLGEFEGETEAEMEGEFETEFESESEGEFESEFEFEGPNPVTKVYPDAMMEHMGLAAMESESEYEAAEHFLPLIPLVASKLLPLAARALPKIASKLLPRVAKVVSRVTPQMTRAVGHLTRALYRNPQTRPLVRIIPSVARRAVATIAKRTAAGHPVTPQQAVRILGQVHRRVVQNPQTVRKVLHRARLLDRRYHPYGRHYAGGVHRAGGVGGYGGIQRVGYGGIPSGTGAHRAGVPYAGRAVGHRSGHGGSAVCPTCGRGARRSCCCC